MGETSTVDGTELSSVEPRHASEPAPRPGRRPRGSLTPDEIVTVAAELVAEEGLERFSMRRLAARLAVNPMTIYLRFDNKEQLLAAMVDRQLGPIDFTGVRDGGWVDRVTALACAIRSHLDQARNLLPVLRDTDHLAVSMLRSADVGLALMSEVGHDDAAAVAAYRSVFWHAVGFSMIGPSLTARAPEAAEIAAPHIEAGELPLLERMLPHFGAIDPDELFRQTTHALVVGLAANAPLPPRGDTP